MWAAPALLAAAALGLLVLRAVLCGGEGHVGHKSGAAAQWSAVLLPPRWGFVVDHWAMCIMLPTQLS
jgi:hypothetical protein